MPSTGSAHGTSYGRWCGGSRSMATTSKWCFASHHRAAALPLHPVPLAATPLTGKIVQAVVERSLGWLGRWRRLSKDYETLPEVSEAMVTLAAIRLMLHRLALNRPGFPGGHFV